jgi:allantoate deiminase
MLAQAREVIRCCRLLADCSEEPGATTRRFLSDPMRDVHARLKAWMDRLGMSVRIDAAGNLRGIYSSTLAGPHPRSLSLGPASPGSPRAPHSGRRRSSRAGPAAPVPSIPRLFIGSHLDTVPHAGAFDGVLGVVLGLALVDLLGGRRFPFTIEVVGFSDEEGVRFGVPFIGSRALAGTVDDELLNRRDGDGRRMSDVIRSYGLDPERMHEARAGDESIGYLEFHIEQGPVLDNLGIPLGIVDAIVGQSRLDVVFLGIAGHAGTTPMTARRDALAGASEWIGVVEREASTTPGLVATVGRVEAQPGAANVIAGRCRASLDIRHANDTIRTEMRDRLIACAREIAMRRGLDVQCEPGGDQGTVTMDPWLVAMLERAVERRGFPVHRMLCGAGHDAMILASRMPAAMLLLRSPDGISHHPDESVVEGDVAAALAAGRQCLEEIAGGEPVNRAPSVTAGRG